MPIALRGAAAVPAGNPTTSFTVTIDAAVLANDLLFLSVTSRDSVSAGTLAVTDNDAGGNTWTKIGNSTDHKATLWYKRATSASASKTVTVSNAVGSSAGVLKAFSGGDTGATPYSNVVVETNASGDETHAGFTPAVADSMLCAAVYNYASNNAVTSLLFATSGATTATEKLSTGGSRCGNIFGHVLQSGGPSATGNLTWAQTNGTTYSITWAVNLPPVPVPPRRLLAGALLATVLAAWAPNPVIVHLENPSSGTPPRVDQPPRYSHAPKYLTAESWRPAPNEAQGQQRTSAALEAALRPTTPRQTYSLERVVAQWQQSWGAQSAQPSAAWNITPGSAPPSVSRYGMAGTIAQWQPNTVVVHLLYGGKSTVEAVSGRVPHQTYEISRILTAWEPPEVGRQGARKVAPLTLDQGQQPPPRRYYAERLIAEQWPSSWVSLEVRTAGVASPGSDSPPPRARVPESINCAWQPNAVVVHLASAWKHATEDSAPTKNRVPEGILAAWQANPVIVHLSPTMGQSVARVDDAQTPQGYLQQDFAASWAIDWRAQKAPPSAAWNVTSPDAPPLRNLYAQQRISAMWVQDWPMQSAPPNAAWNVLAVRYGVANPPLGIFAFLAGARDTVIVHVPQETPPSTVPSGGGGGFSPYRHSSLSQARHAPGVRQIIEQDDEMILEVLMKAVIEGKLH